MPKITKEEFIEFMQSEESKDFFADSEISGAIEGLESIKGLKLKNRELLIVQKKLKDEMNKSKLFNDEEYEEYQALKADLEQANEWNATKDDGQQGDQSNKKELYNLQRQLDKMKKDYEQLINQNKEKDTSYSTLLQQYQREKISPKLESIFDENKVAKTHRPLIKKAWLDDTLYGEDGEVYMKVNDGELPIIDYATDFFSKDGKVYIEKPSNTGGGTTQTGMNINSKKAIQEKIQEYNSQGKFAAAMMLMDKVNKEK